MISGWAFRAMFISLRKNNKNQGCLRAPLCFWGDILFGTNFDIIYTLWYKVLLYIGILKWSWWSLEILSKCVVFSMTFTAFTFSLKCPTSFPPSLLSPFFLSLHKYVVGPILGTTYDFSNMALLLLSFFSRLLFPTHYTVLCASGNLFKYHSSSLILVAVISST